MNGVALFGAIFYFYWGCSTIPKELLINDQIRAKEVRLLDEEGQQVGLVPIAQARAYANERDVDLVLIAPQAQPPVCRAMDYGKYRYEQDKREKEQKKKQTVMEVKEVQLTYRIDTHDFETKVNNAIRFLSAGNKVRVCLKFRGREMAHQSLGLELLDRFTKSVSDYAQIDKKPVLEGRQFTMFLAPLPAKQIAANQQARAQQAAEAAEKSAAEAQPKAN